MIRKIIVRKASYVRFILIIGAFFLFIPRSLPQYNFDANCQQAYEAILSLRFSEAHNLLDLENKAEPDNLLTVYLENYIDFLTLVIGEDRVVYDQLKVKKIPRLKILEMGHTDSPFYNFCLGEFHLQWAFSKLKFGDYTAAAFEIHKAYNLFSANKSRYPDFVINNIGLGVVHVMVSLVPDNYKWVSALIGLNGSMELGLSEIRQVAEYSGSDKITRMYKPQASFFLAFLVSNLQKNKKDAMPLLKLLNNQTVDGHQLRSPLLIYAGASILMKNGFNDQALAMLDEGKSLQQTFNFCYLDYLEGIARLNKLDYSASLCFDRFIASFRGRNYIRSAYQKLAWISFLKGDSANYHRMMNQMPARGALVVDEDKQANFEAVNLMAPNIILLRARLLCDGGYYGLAINELLNNSVKTAVKSKRDLVEYTYRLGRIYHETGNAAKAIDNYQQTISRGRTEPYYFAAGAAYQLGLLYENMGAYAKAEGSYHICLSIKPREYQTSLHQKAKAGLNRIKKAQSKI
jgi:tetratricopeptide (TPR) repeat protein